MIKLGWLIPIVAVVLGILVAVGIQIFMMETGRTFGGRCEALGYEKDTTEFDVCVRLIGKGEDVPIKIPVELYKLDDATLLAGCLNLRDEPRYSPIYDEYNWTMGHRFILNVPDHPCRQYREGNKDERDALYAYWSNKREEFLGFVPKRVYCSNPDLFLGIRC